LDVALFAKAEALVGEVVLFGQAMDHLALVGGQGRRKGQRLSPALVHCKRRDLGLDLLQPLLGHHPTKECHHTI
jgi:hypothetical protein